MRPLLRRISLSERGVDWVAVRTSRINGRGLFAVIDLPRRRKLGEISGTLERLPRARAVVANLPKIYLIELSRRYALDCARGNSFKYLNHSCEPNCYLRTCGKRVEVYTLHHIKAGTELTVDYGVTPHKTGMKCACGAARCRRIL